MWILISIIAIVIVYDKLKPLSNVDLYNNCKEEYSRVITNKISNVYYGGRLPVIVELCSGEELIWKCNYADFVIYRSDLENYSGKSFLDKLMGKNNKKYFRIDSLYKPANSFDFFIFLNSHPDSLIVLNCDFKCDEIINNN